MNVADSIPELARTIRSGTGRGARTAQLAAVGVVLGGLLLAVGLANLVRGADYVTYARPAFTIWLVSGILAALAANYLAIERTERRGWDRYVMAIGAFFALLGVLWFLSVYPDSWLGGDESFEVPVILLYALGIGVLARNARGALGRRVPGAEVVTSDGFEQTDESIVTVQNLQTAFFTDKETIRAVDGVSFDLTPGDTVGIVGESGSGKSVTARSIMGLVESPGRVLEGSSVRFNHLPTVREFARRFPNRTVDVEALADEQDMEALFNHADVDATPGDFGYKTAEEVPLAEFLAASYGEAMGLVDEDDCVFVTRGDPSDPDSIDDGFIEISRLEGEAQRAMRGSKIAMVFQDPLTSLNPVYTVGNQIKEALRLHQGLRGQEATREAIELLEAVGIPDARRRVSEYPHQFSGGMRQRAVIAMALACDPEVLICDEPTTALDVTIQAQILDLLAELQEERDLAIMFITHDMGVIAEVTDRVNVMYAGEIVESAGVESLFGNPKHPYTQGLLRSIPGEQTGDRLETIEGNVPTPNEPATDCRFAPRCPKAFEDCEQVHPVSVSVGEDDTTHTAACLLYPEDVPTEQAVEHHIEAESGGKR